MTDLTISGEMAVTTGPANSRWLAKKRFMEGRATIRKDGVVSFPASAHNLDVWKSVFPDCQVANEVVFDDMAAIANRPPFAFKTTPYQHQIDGFEKFKQLPAFALLMEMGTGKSKVLTDVAAYKYAAGEIDAMIVLSPKGVHFQWVDEQLPAHLGCTYQAWAWLKTKKALEDFETRVKTFEGFKIVSMNVDACKTKDGFAFLETFIQSVHGRCLFAIDEATSIKEARSARAVAATKLGKKCKFRAILTGSPIAKNVADLWSEYMFLDPNIIGTKYFTTFRNNFCEVKPNGFQGFDIVGVKNAEKLYARIDPYTFRATKSELNLPEKMYDTVHFEMHDDQKRMYKELKKTLLLELESSKVEASNAASVLVKLQQISCGWVKDENGKINDLPNARLDTLAEILENRDDPIIIWCRFIHDIKNVMKLLDKRAVSYYGETNDIDREEAKAAFLGGRKQFFVGNPAAAGIGLNLQGNCTTAIYYSNSYNAMERQQSEDRIHRLGTKGTCTYIDLIGRGTVDARILENLRNKKSISTFVLDEVRSLFA